MAEFIHGIKPESFFGPYKMKNRIFDGPFKIVDNIMVGSFTAGIEYLYDGSFN